MRVVQLLFSSITQSPREFSPGSLFLLTSSTTTHRSVCSSWVDSPTYSRAPINMVCEDRVDRKSLSHSIFKSLWNLDDHNRCHCICSCPSSDVKSEKQGFLTDLLLVSNSSALAPDSAWPPSADDNESNIFLFHWVLAAVRDKVYVQNKMQLALVRALFVMVFKPCLTISF